jgi:uncharacterized protein (TIGR02284 family)
MSKTTAEKLNDVLRGERSAVETYKQALSKLTTDPRADGLREIQADHLHAVSSLKRHVSIRGKDPETSSGAWGGVAKSVMGTAKIFGDKATLKALKQGEEHGLNQYNDLIQDSNVEPVVRDMVRNTMIPKQKEHIRKIERIMDQAG